MNSVIQFLLSGTVPELAKRYGTDKDITKHTLLTSVSPKEAPSELLCQTTKLSCALMIELSLCYATKAYCDEWSLCYV